MPPIAIVAHTDRREMAEQLAATTAAQVFYDDGTLGCKANHLRAWQHHADNPSGDFSVVLEDDAQPVTGFLSQLDRALEVAPTPIVSLYLGTGAPLAGWQHAIKQTIQAIHQTRAAWITSTHLLHCVGVAIRTEHLTSLVEWLPQIPLPIDEAITHWANHTINHPTPISYTWPSLTNHADTPSLVRPRTTPRRAWRTATRQAWNSEHITLQHPHAHAPTAAFLTGTAAGHKGH